MEVSIGDAMGANTSGTRATFTAFIPDRDKKNKIIDDHQEWVDRIMVALTEVCGGCTMVTNVGYYKTKKEIIKETTAVAYSYINDLTKFKKELVPLRSLLHTFGKETKQASVAFICNNIFYEITNFKP